MKYQDQLFIIWHCDICDEDIGDETGYHRESKKHYAFTGKELIKRTYITNKPN